jgi:ATP-dependent Clp protease ATP-binding subunit ClpB
MSEYQEQHSVSRLIGSPPGYVGHDEGGQLTEAVRRRPYTVVLFDEVEKAHSKVLTTLLQVLDEGRLTDGKGRTVDFTNTVIILTSNIGAEFLLNMTENTSEQQKEAAQDLVMEKVRNTFSPEFLNRLSAIIMFNALGPKQLEKIVQKSMKGIKRRLASKGIKVFLESSGAKAILDVSYDSNYGARPVERYLEGTVVTVLSKMLISGELSSGCVVRIAANDDESSDDCNVPMKKRMRTDVLRYTIERDPDYENDIRTSENDEEEYEMPDIEIVD